jgi:hypothetical protein
MRKTCASPDFNVTVTTGDGIDGARLSVSRVTKIVGFWPKCEHDGKLFKNADEAWQFAADYGYLSPYYRRSCVVSPAFAKLESQINAARFDALYRQWQWTEKRGFNNANLFNRLVKLAKKVSIFHPATKTFANA